MLTEMYHRDLPKPFAAVELEGNRKQLQKEPTRPRAPVCEQMHILKLLDAHNFPLMCQFLLFLPVTSDVKKPRQILSFQKPVWKSAFSILRRYWLFFLTYIPLRKICPFFLSHSAEAGYVICGKSQESYSVLEHLRPCF